MCTAACYLPLSQLYTKHGYALKAVTGERDEVNERGLHFPTKPTQVLKLFPMHYGDLCPDLVGCFVLVPIRPANPGHFKVP